MAVPDVSVVRRHVRVTGRVQNVTYRESTRREAGRLGVAGWVRNLPDGSVEAALEGPQDAVEALLAWMHRGPLLAGVEVVDATVVPPEGDETFRVR